MSLPSKITTRVRHRCAPIALCALVGATGFAGLGSVSAAGAVEPPLQSLRAPFTCGTEWSGSTRVGHGLNDWNLDINSTSRTFANRQYDLGAPLLAQADGTVVWIGTHDRAGTYVEIDYGDITASYVHLVDGSVPAALAVGSQIAEGQPFGRLGDSGNATHAHLHLEYFDSRDFPDARAYQLPGSNQIPIAMDGVLIAPGDVFVSTNCSRSSPLEAGTSFPAPPHPFIDVSPTSFAYHDIALLYRLEVTTGTGATSYAPAENVTREQMAAFLARLWRTLTANTATNLSHSALPDSVDHSPLPFDDVDPTSFAHADIALLAQLGITKGTSPTTYSPDDDVTREQMAAFLARLWQRLDPVEPTPQGIELVAAEEPTMPFDDVVSTSFAHTDIALLAQLGITKGTSPTTYSPDDDVTREQMAAFLARFHRTLTGDEEPDHEHSK